MGNREAKLPYQKQPKEEDIYKAMIIEQGKVPVDAKDIETKWKLYHYELDDAAHFAVLVRDNLAVSFGVGFYNDNTAVIPNVRVLEMTGGKPNRGTLKGETVENLAISHIVVEYLNQLEKFGKYDICSNNCIDFTHTFLEHMGKCEFMSRRRCYLKAYGKVCLKYRCGKI